MSSRAPDPRCAPADLALAVALQRCMHDGVAIRTRCAALQQTLNGRSYDDLGSIRSLLRPDARAARMPDSDAFVVRLARPDRREAPHRPASCADAPGGAPAGGRHPDARRAAPMVDATCGCIRNGGDAGGRAAGAWRRMQGDSRCVGEHQTPLPRDARTADCMPTDAVALHPFLARCAYGSAACADDSRRHGLTHARSCPMPCHRPRTARRIADRRDGGRTRLRCCACSSGNPIRRPRSTDCGRAWRNNLPPEVRPFLCAHPAAPSPSVTTRRRRWMRSPADAESIVDANG